MADERKRSEDQEKESGKKGKKEKKEKAPKPEKKGKNASGDEAEKKGKKGKKEKVKKTHPVIKTFFLTSLVWLALLFVFTALTFFNIFTLKEVVLQFFNPEEDFEVMFASDIEALEDYENELDLRSDELDERDYELDDRESELDDRESELDDREYELEEKYPWAFDEDTQDFFISPDISSVAKTVAGMNPRNAANALLAMSVDTVVMILNEMKPAERAAILDQMEEDDAASIIETMVEPD